MWEIGPALGFGTGRRIQFDWNGYPLRSLKIPTQGGGSHLTKITIGVASTALSLSLCNRWLTPGGAFARP